jgi:hypothetical protein
MPSLADVVRRHGSAYLGQHRGSALPSHVRAVGAITRCRTPALGGHLAQCERCAKEHLLYHSCRHRACAQCGQDSTRKWLTQQRELLLPVPYFHVVFTLPAELRRVVRTHQKALLSVLFRAAFESLQTLCLDRRFLGARIGAIAVLHTWTRTLEWHPHVHLLVPGGGLSRDGLTWLRVPKRQKAFLVPVRALAKLFRGRFLHLARRGLPEVTLPEVPWNKSWVVFAKPVVHGRERVLDYLGRYVHRTAVSDRSILATDERSVTFRYRDSRDGARKTMTLPAHEFLRRFLQHVPPKGFHRVRAFGLLHAARRSELRRLQLLLASRDPPSPVPPVPSGSPPRLRCPHCKDGSLHLLRRLDADECRAFASALAPATLIQPGARAPPP